LTKSKFLSYFIEAINLSGELENFLERRIDPTLLWKYPTIEVLSGCIRRVLIVIEGLYSMDKDIPELPQFIAVK
jgi:7-keto-8-aminopelargonate synthetase-like enzyme